MARIFLGLMAVLFIVPSFLYIADPAGGFAANGAQIAGAAALTDVRVMYGLFPIGIGLFLLPAVFGRASVLPALWLCLSIFALIVLGRLIGLAIDHGDQHFTRMCLTFEGPALLLSALVLWATLKRGRMAPEIIV